MPTDTTLLRHARQAIDHLARHGLLRDHQLDVLHEVVRMAEQRGNLLEALAAVRAQEADALEALRQYLAVHTASGPCGCACCVTARGVLRR
jgi:hypothetical protein